MLLKNYYTAMAASFVSWGTYDTGMTLKTVSGNTYPACSNGSNTTLYYASPGYCMTSLATSLARGTVLGDGTKEVSIDDYTLSGNVISTLTASFAMSYKGSDDGLSVTAKITLTNPTENDVTVSEIGLIENCKSGTSSSARQPVMLARTLLDTPITIPAGGVGVVDHTINFALPTA